jgi:Undecaprenyl-phosphate glucose phosphotransferase
MTSVAAKTASRYVDDEVVQRLLKAMDFTVFFATAMFYTATFASRPDAPNGTSIIAFFSLALTFLCLLLLRDLGLYKASALVNGNWTFLKSAAAVIIAGAAAYKSLDYFLIPLEAPSFLYWTLVITVHLALSRLAAQVWARPIASQGRFRKRVAIVGGGRVADDALHVLEASRDLEIEVIGLFDDRDEVRSAPPHHDHKKIGTITDLATYARNNRVDLIIVAIPLSAEARLLYILKRLWELPVDIRISGKASSLKFSSKAYTYIGRLPLLAVFDRPLMGWGLFLKNVFDRVIASTAIVVLAPVMLAVAVAIRLESKGPVLFKQKRYGFNNELIEVFKFRSMHANRCDAHATTLVSKGDPRVTRVGRFIRKTSLDELPQLFNVLTGQLSLVGPRPHATQAKAADTLYEQVVDGYFARHRVRPGITGWAQVNGWRGETDTREKIEQRVKHDLDYIDHWSLMFDVKILMRTPFALLKSENAY